MAKHPFFGEPLADDAKNTPKVNLVKGILRENRLSILFIVVVALLALFFNTCTIYIKPGEFGVKQVQYSPLGIFGPMGTHDKIYFTGLHHEFPTMEKIHTFPRTVQVLTMRTPGNNAQEAEVVTSTDEKFTRLAKAAHIQTSDGFYVDLDVAILYRIVDPVKLVNRVGAGKLYEDNGIMSVAENSIKIRLGSLEPEDFFIPATRTEKLNEARDLMNEKLEEMGLKVEQVLPLYPHLHPDVAVKIEENNLQKQTKQLNMALTSQSAAEAALAKVVSDGIAAKSVALQGGTAYQTEKASEMDRYSRSRRAEGDMIRKMAEARKSELINNAYKGAGSDTMVGLKMAHNLTNLEAILVPMGGPGSFNPLDLTSTLRLFAGGTNAPVETQAPAK
jgi:regulator of protease activity HflC (stomatin/prohibitin superfamily)